MAELHRDFLEQILKRLNVKDLIRCKSVCKSWSDFISTPIFIKSHLNRSYSIDCNDNGLDKRIVMENYTNKEPRSFELHDICITFDESHLLGSSNGLVCSAPFCAHPQIVVANPSTREVKRLKNPQVPDHCSLCWGFGYDSSTDDYKVIKGSKKVIGDVKYSFVSRIGILCNGALHWVMKDGSSENNKNVILSFNLSEEEFKEFPQPDDEGYESGVACLPTMRLGIMEECLCVFLFGKVIDSLWMMKNYNVKESWGMVGKDPKIKFSVHCLKQLKHYIPNKRSLCNDMWYGCNQKFIGSPPVFVESLVSPHVNGKPKRKRQSSNSKKTCKLTKGDPSVPGPSGKY